MSEETSRRILCLHTLMASFFMNSEDEVVLKESCSSLIKQIIATLSELLEDPNNSISETDLKRIKRILKKLQSMLQSPV